MTGFPTYSSDAGLSGRDDAWEPTILNLRRPPTGAPPLPSVLHPGPLTPPLLAASELSDSESVPTIVMRLPDVAALTHKSAPAWYTYLAPVAQWLAIGLGALLALYLIFGGHRTPVRPSEEAPAWIAPQSNPPAAQPAGPSAAPFDSAPSAESSAPAAIQERPAPGPAPMIPPSAPLYENDPLPGDSQPALSPSQDPSFELPPPGDSAARGIRGPADRLRTAQRPEAPAVAPHDAVPHEPQALGITPIAVPQ